MRFPSAAVFAGRLPPSLSLSLLLMGGSIFSAVSQDPSEGEQEETFSSSIICFCPDGTPYFSVESCELTKEQNCPDLDSSQCPKQEEGGNVSVIFDQPHNCLNCRKLNARRSILPVQTESVPCFELLFTLFNRGVVDVVSCPSANILDFFMYGADIITPFTTAERSFFTKTANNVRANTPVDLNIPGTLDLFTALASEALAVWPSDQFPIAYTYPTSPPRDWFDQDELLKEEQCPSEENGTAPAATPTQAAPTFGQISPATGPTEPAVIVDLQPVPSQGSSQLLRPTCNKALTAGEEFTFDSYIMDYDFFSDDDIEVHHQFKITVKCDPCTGKAVNGGTVGPTVVENDLDASTVNGPIVNVINQDELQADWSGIAFDGDMAGWTVGAAAGSALGFIFLGPGPDDLIFTGVGGLVGGIFEGIFDDEIDWSYRRSAKFDCVKQASGSWDVVMTEKRKPVIERYEDNDWFDFYTKYDP